MKMKRPHLLCGRVLPAAAALFFLTLVRPAAVAEDATTAPYFSPDPSHLWNRVYAALPPVTRFGFAPEPWKAEKKEEATAVLTEFVKEGATAPETMTPLQRALLQRHLIVHFHAAAINRGESTVEPKKDTEYIAALARAIRKIALTAEEIRKLPDNYAAATALPDAVTEYDSEKPAPFLPKDLLADDGPWLGLTLTPQGGRQGVVAQLHFAEFYRALIAFEVRMRHPEGRAAGEAYLKSLAEMPEPYVKEGTPETGALTPNGATGGRHPNPQTPQFPPGTAWALVHRSILADANGRPVVSPLVEAVQIRVYRTLELKEEPVAPGEEKKTDIERMAGAAERYQTMFDGRCGTR